MQLLLRSARTSPVLTTWLLLGLASGCQPDIEIFRGGTSPGAPSPGDAGLVPWESGTIYYGLDAGAPTYGDAGSPWYVGDAGPGAPPWDQGGDAGVPVTALDAGLPTGDAGWPATRYWHDCGSLLGPYGDPGPLSLTGDRCGWDDDTGCSSGIRNGYATSYSCHDGVLFVAGNGRVGCSPQARPHVCGKPSPARCCIDIWQCDADNAASPSGNIVRTCELECDNVPSQAPLLSACPRGHDYWGPNYDPVPGQGCQGDFVCDRMGRPMGADNEGPIEGSFFWCQDGQIRQAEFDAELFWGTAACQGQGDAG
jgi:hypothetical protein